jgi:predicted ester cyclase
MMNQDYSFSNPMAPAPISGEQRIGMMQMMTAAFDGGHILDLVLEDGNYIVASGKWSGKHTGEFNGIPATGNHVEISFIEIFQIMNGKVSADHMELSPMGIMQQIGAVPMKG